MTAEPMNWPLGLKQLACKCGEQLLVVYVNVLMSRSPPTLLSVSTIPWLLWLPITYKLCYALTTLTLTALGERDFGTETYYD